MPCEPHGNCQKLARPKRFELLTPRFVVWWGERAVAARHGTSFVPWKFTKFLGLIGKRRLTVTTSDRSGRMSDDGVEDLFGNAAAKAHSLERMPPCVVGRQL